MQLASLTPDAITFTLLLWDSDKAMRAMYRIPVSRLKVAPWLEGDPEGTTRAFLPVVDGGFWLEEIHSANTAFDEEEGTIVEIGVRGGLIVDANGQLVAAGGGYVETRPGWPGSDFISVFTVLPPSPAPRRSGRRGARY